MKRFIIIIFVIALGLAVYFFLSKGDETGYKVPDMNGASIISVASTTAENIKNKTSDIFSGVATDLKNKGTEIVSSAIEKTKDSALNAIKQGVKNGIDQLEEKVGITNNNEANIPVVNSPDNFSGDTANNNVVYSIKKEAPAYFTVKNNEGELSYEVDWLDGKKDSGQLTQKNESAVLSHKWASAGEYSITFKIVDSKGEKEYKILIAVID